LRYRVGNLDFKNQFKNKIELTTVLNSGKALIIKKSINFKTLRRPRLKDPAQ